MPSSTVLPPAAYLAHWVRAIRWLAAQPSGTRITLTDRLSASALQTAATKARSMRASVLAFPQWPEEVQGMVREGSLRFEKEGGRLIAYRSAPRKPLPEAVFRLGKFG